MRTTVTLDPDVEQALREQVRRTGVPFKQLINRIIRAGLKAQSDAPPAPPYEPIYVDMGEPAVDLTQAARLAAALEDDEIIRRYRQAR